MNEYPYLELSDKVIKCFYTVYNKLGFGFLEKVYTNALMIELERSGLHVEKQKQIKVYYDKVQVGEYYADLIVEDSIILELKAAEGLVEEHEMQLINYLRATEKEIGLLLNFGKKPQIRRKIFTNDRKILHTD
ncbi:MAG: GxxExxY protein [Bacteroidetes bacterium]|nr:GxxExxY protein [Bacteroidota bacterium]